MINKFDAIIIGFGKAGKTLAGDLGNRGQKVALIEKSPNMYGGTCINKACIPTKALENSAGIIRRENLNNTDEKFAKYEDAINKKEILINYIRNNNISFVYSCGLIYFNKSILQLVDSIDDNIKFAIPNNNLICCGEGICGACTMRLNNCRIKTCKAQMNGREFLSNLK